VAVTQGSSAQAEALCDRFGAPFPCLADPRRAGYEAFGLKRGSWWEVVGPAALIRGREATRRGHHIEKTIGDVMQMPGTFIIDRKGIVRYARYARHSGDHPSTDELLDALRSLTP
jgi:peroxiredoxin